MIAKENLLKLFKKEFTTTLKVMRAYPEDKLDFTPHERSKTAKQNMATFVFEMYLMKSYAFGASVESAVFKNYSPDEFMMMMLFDQIHHRGQMSVYIRLAGGKVPSIYGPSADDSSTNL